MDIPPWTVGPFELIKHAHGHLLDDGDTDRRIALVGFDNAIEVCIDVFVKLHPRLRNGFAMSRDESAKALQNYHSKIEFLDKYIKKQNVSIDVPVENIVWYHQLRNEIYHSGNGMVPEHHVLEGLQAASIVVFQALFEEDISSKLGVTHNTVQPYVSYYGPDVQMHFLRYYVAIERQLSDALNEEGPPSFATPPMTQMWSTYRKKLSDPEDWDQDVMDVMQIRDSIVYGKGSQLSIEEIEDGLDELIHLGELIDDVESGRYR